MKTVKHFTELFEVVKRIIDNGPDENSGYVLSLRKDGTLAVIEPSTGAEIQLRADNTNDIGALVSELKVTGPIPRNPTEAFEHTELIHTLADFGQFLERAAFVVEAVT